MNARAIVLILILLVGAASVAARAWLDAGPRTAPGDAAAEAIGGPNAHGGPEHAFSGSVGKSTPGTVQDDAGTTESGAPAGALGKALPYLTEGSMFALIGFALGYTSRKIVKLMLILLALIFAGIQGLAYANVLTVDWSKALDLANDLILNVNSQQPVGDFLRDKIPSFGAFAAGYLLGFRKG